MRGSPYPLFQDSNLLCHSSIKMLFQLFLIRRKKINCIPDVSKYYFQHKEIILNHSFVDEIWISTTFHFLSKVWHWFERGTWWNNCGNYYVHRVAGAFSSFWTTSCWVASGHLYLLKPFSGCSCSYFHVFEHIETSSICVIALLKTLKHVFIWLVSQICLCSFRTKCLSGNFFIFLRMQWRLIYIKVIRCFALRFWMG